MANDKIIENDLELLNRIHQNDEVALERMIEKYSPLIYKKIILYRFPLEEKIDYYQEGVMVLNKAINTYREDNPNKKTFTRYFELLLCNRFNSLYRANKKKNQYILMNDDEINAIADESTELSDVFNDINTDSLSVLEKAVFDLHFVQNLKIKDVSEKLGLNAKQIYNTLIRIRKKIK